jgi:hypothetical protein
MCVTNLFVVLNYLFSLDTKLFGDVESFVRDIHFSLFILYNQILVMFNILFVENNHLFVLLKYFKGQLTSSASTNGAHLQGRLGG